MPTADRHLPSTAKERVLSVDNSHSDVTRRRGTRGSTASWPSALDYLADEMLDEQARFRLLLHWTARPRRQGRSGRDEVGRSALRQISAALAEAGYLTAKNKPYSAQSVASMLDRK